MPTGRLGPSIIPGSMAARTTPSGDSPAPLPAPAPSPAPAWEVEVVKRPLADIMSVCGGADTVDQDPNRKLTF